MIFYLKNLHKAAMREDSTHRRETWPETDPEHSKAPARPDPPEPAVKTPVDPTAALWGELDV